jgi:CBS domain-containing protein
MAVWKGLIRHNFLSLPIVGKNGWKYLGFLDVMDIVKYIISAFGQVRDMKKEQDFWSLINSETKIRDATVKDALASVHHLRHKWYEVSTGYSLWLAMEIMAREGVHRIAIVDRMTRRVVSIITQSQLIAFLHKNMDHLGPLKDKPVSVIGGEKENVLMVKKQEMALHAFELMSTHNVSAVAVVDEGNRIVDNLSIKDIKRMFDAGGVLFWSLYYSVDQYLIRVRKETPGRPDHPITVTMTDTLQTVVSLMVTHKIHRIYVVDKDHNIPIGVISMRDILMQVVGA